MLESRVWVSNVFPVRKLVVGLFLYPGISSRFWAHMPACIGEPEGTAGAACEEQLPTWPLQRSAPRSFLCRMEKEGKGDRSCLRPRCWVCSRPGLETLLARDAGSPSITQPRFTAWSWHSPGIQRREKQSRLLPSGHPPT